VTSWVSHSSIFEEFTELGDVSEELTSSLKKGAVSTTRNIGRIT
jgi:hypothetical protein